jgi:signal transduction histidine kinase
VRQEASQEIDLFSVAPCGLVVTTKEAEIVRANPEFLKWVGRRGAVGQTLQGTFSIGSRIFYETHVAPLVRLQGQVEEAAVDLLREDGGKLPTLLNIRMEGDQQIVVVFPATERRRYEAELLSAERQARQSALQLSRAQVAAEAANAAKSLFLANMCHELRTPMNGVLGFAALLRDTQLTEVQREYMDTIQDSGEALLRIINDLLDLAKAASGKLELEAVPFDLLRVAGGVCELLVPRVADGKVKLVLDWDPRVVAEQVGDAGRVRQVLLNLAGNAVKFTEAGTVTVKVSYEGEQRLRIAVADTGPGIAAEYADRVFEKFDQGDLSLARRYGGTGLGLAIARDLVRAMGGEIGLTSVVGAGSTFWFELPRRDAGVGSRTENDGRGRKVLLLDEVAESRAAAQKWLESWGWTVVSEGEAAVVIAMEAPPDLPELPWVRLRRPWSRPEHFREELIKSLDGVEPIGPVAPAVEPLAVPRCRVLVVEDNLVNQRLAKVLLEKLGCLVDVAGDGHVAVDLATTTEYEMIFMDCLMPRMDGWEATRRLRLAGLVIPIVALTANAMEGDRERCAEAGMSDFVSKPIRVTELAETLHRWVGE